LIIDKTFLIAEPMRKVSWTKCFVAGGESVGGRMGRMDMGGAVVATGAAQQRREFLVQRAA
jgi:hypothetical protein